MNDIIILHSVFVRRKELEEGVWGRMYSIGAKNR